MNTTLTPQERALLAKFETTGRWDQLLYDVSLLIPSFIIMGLGMRFDSPATTITGMFVYAAFALRSGLHQAKVHPQWKSLIEKLKGAAESSSERSSTSAI
jgi:hypothetical protein